MTARLLAKGAQEQSYQVLEQLNRSVDDRLHYLAGEIGHQFSKSTDEIQQRIDRSLQFTEKRSYLLGRHFSRLLGRRASARRCYVYALQCLAHFLELLA